MDRVIATLLAGMVLLASPAARAQEAVVSRGSTPAGYALAVAPADGAPRVLCEPSCEIGLPVGPLRIGWRRDAREIEWQRTIDLQEDVRLDIRVEDRSAHRGAGHVLLVIGALLLAATAIVGIATEPEAPELGWFGPQHGLVFAGIAGGIVIALGVPGVALALAFERDAPAVEVVATE